MSNIQTRLYRNGILETESFPIADVSDLVKEDHVAVWVDFVSPTEAQLREISDELELHDLAIEDAIHQHQRPKVDYYENHLFIASHAVSLNESEGTIDIVEINAFVKGNCLITVRKGEGFDIDRLKARWRLAPEKNGVDVGFLLYGLLDVIIDGYLETVVQFDDYYDTISEGIFEDTPLDPTHQKEWFNMRRSLVKFHRIIISMREAINILLRREHNVIVEDMVPYFHDLYDHVLRVSESSDTLRELVSTIVDTNISLRDYRQNQVVKKVTSWAAIVAVPTLVTGYYGMNVPFPGSQNNTGVIVSACLIGIAPLWLYFTFRKRDWL